MKELKSSRVLLTVAVMGVVGIAAAAEDGRVADRPGQTEVGVAERAGPRPGLAGLAHAASAPGVAHRIGLQATPTQRPELIAPGATMEKVSSGHRFTEGPAIYRDRSLFFSDVQSQLIHRLTPDGAVGIHRRYSGGANGLYFDHEWRLVSCDMQAQRLSIDDLEGQVRALVDSYGGSSLNAPNDLWIHPDGGIYFTDPDFRGSGARSRVYYLGPGGDLKKVIDDIRLPNGVIGTPDGHFLYVTDYDGTATWRYRIGGDGALTDKQRFSPIGGDGMTLDERGNVYLAAGDVLVFGPEGGDPIESIDVPEAPSNITFGGADGRVLYITALTSVYSIEMNVRGAFAPGAVASPTATATASPVSTATPGASATATPTASASPTETQSASRTPGPGPTPSSEVSPTLPVAEEWVLGLPILYRQ